MLEDLPVSLTYEAARPSAHPEAVQAVLDGEITTHKQYKQLEQSLKAAEQKTKQLEDKYTKKEPSQAPLFFRY